MLFLEQNGKIDSPGLLLKYESLKREIEINIPLYNDYGEAIGKIKDYNSAKFDVRIIAGSTLPINRWAYLGELKELLQLGVVDDIAVLAEMTDQMAVMYAGSIVEIGPTDQVFSNPKHAYTKLLLESTPSVVGEKKKLRSLDGEPASLIDEVSGCSFAPRCPDRDTSCNPTLDMELIESSSGHFVDICCSEGK